MFDNFISLGSWCPTAASMSKYGLRSWAGPFDWLGTTNLASVLRLIECNFKDFLLPENLENLPDNIEAFKDRKNSIIFFHDIEYSISLEKSYAQLYKKYQKKIKRLTNELSKRNCFLRSVDNNEELQYIAKNRDYINEIIKKQNQESEIVFLLEKGLTVPDELNFRYYIMPGQYDGVPRRVLRSWFDGAEEFLSYCGQNFDGATLLKNIMFDRAEEEKQTEIIETRYRLLTKLCNLELNNLPEHQNLVIYGAGNIGRFFYKLVNSRYSIKYFVDKEKAGSNIDGIPVVWLSDLKDIKPDCFVVSATYDYDHIYKTIKSYCAESVVISLEDLLS